MFEVRIIVEDSKLHKALWALDGLIVGQPQLLPVRNAVASKDKTRVKSAGKGNIPEQLRAWIDGKGGGSAVTAAGISEFLLHHGIRKTSAGGYIDRLMKGGRIKRQERGVYEVK